MISIIVPIYNVERFLLSTLDSLIHQNGDVDYEILLIDDGSTDKSADICDKYACEYSKISVIHKSNGGLSSARNAGIDAARGEYLMFVDGDDCLDSVTISALTKAVSSHQNCDVIQFRYEEVSPAVPFGHCTSKDLINYYECKEEQDYFLQLYQLGGVAASACTKLIKRNVIGDLRFKEGIIHEDEEFITRLLPRCKCIGYCSNEFHKYAMRIGSIIHSDFSRKRLDVITILKERIIYLEKQGYKDLAKKFSNKLYANLRRLWNDAYIAKDMDSVHLIEQNLSELVYKKMKVGKGVFDTLVLKSGNCRSLILRLLFNFKKIFKPILQKVRNAKIKYSRYKKCKARRKQLKFTDFTIISNNCWGGFVYQYFGLPYNTPIAGCGFMDDDYLKFLERFDYYISLPLVFIKYESSKRYNYYLQKNINRPSCPIAMLDDVEICFTHYTSEKEAREKWEKRCKRINKDRMLIKMSQRYTSTVNILDRFDALPYKNKICFTALDYPKEGFIKIEELAPLNRIGGDETPFVMDKVDLISLINEIR
jgi:uncharacterized protein (DUF1919 family)/GT2 family glycosyltransferase